jgi:hypothetical protein
MAVLLKCKAVFLHLPKTGGTFIRKVFRSLDLVRFNFSRDHADMKRVINIYDHYPGNYWCRSIQFGGNVQKHINQSFKFCFVRHPFDWYASYWRFNTDLGWRSFIPQNKRTRWGFKYDTWHPLAPLEEHAINNFSEFMDRVIQHKPGFLTNLYHAYAMPEHIDFVGKQENLVEDISTVLSRLNVQHDISEIKKLKHENKSKTKMPEWKHEHKEKIFELEKAVFEKYNYEFK